MTLKDVYGLGAHADVPVTTEEDEAFKAFAQRAETPAVSSPVKVRQIMAGPGYESSCKSPAP